MNLDELLVQVGSDKEALLSRFMGNEAMVKKFLRKFLEDTSYEKMAEDVKNKDYAALEASSHTLKGLSANLGLQNLFEASVAILADVREQHTERVDEDFVKAQAAYEEAVRCIKELED